MIFFNSIKVFKIQQLNMNIFVLVSQGGNSKTF